MAARTGRASTVARPAHYTIRGAAEWANLDERTIRRAIESGELRAVSPRGVRVVRIPAASLDEWLQPAHGLGRSR
jgi:excisionase family DNA binding protein